MTEPLKIVKFVPERTQERDSALGSICLVLYENSGNYYVSPILPTGWLRRVKTPYPLPVSWCEVLDA